MEAISGAGNLRTDGDGTWDAVGSERNCMRETGVAKGKRKMGTQHALIDYHLLFSLKITQLTLITIYIFKYK